MAETEKPSWSRLSAKKQEKKTAMQERGSVDLGMLRRAQVELEALKRISDPEDGERFHTRTKH